MFWHTSFILIGTKIFALYNNQLQWITVLNLGYTMNKVSYFVEKIVAMQYAQIKYKQTSISKKAVLYTTNFGTTLKNARILFSWQHLLVDCLRKLMLFPLTEVLWVWPIFPTTWHLVDKKKINQTISKWFLYWHWQLISCQTVKSRPKIDV